MNLNDNVKVGLALLKEVEEKMKDYYLDTAALAPDSRYNPIYDVENEELQKQLDIGEKKIGDFQDGLAYLNFLRGRLLAIKQSPMSNRKMLKCADYYQRAIELGYDETVARFFWGLHHKVWNKKDKAITQFERVVSIAGVDSELGLEAAKEIEKLKAKKGGCFIATAIYGSEDASEVLVLRCFRDEILASSKLGRLLASVYYLISPPVARLLNSSSQLRNIVRKTVVHPIIDLCRSKLNKNQKKR